MKKKIIIKNGQLWLDNICLIPIISGKVSFAEEVRDIFLNLSFDSVAIGLPASFYPSILRGIQSLPYISVLLAQERDGFYHYFPIDPCDGMIEATRLAMQEGCNIRFIDREIGDMANSVRNNSNLSHLLEHHYMPPKPGLILPDEYALKKVGLSAYIQAVFPGFIPNETSWNEQEDKQARFMASRLQELSLEYKKILFVFSLHYLPSILHYYQINFQSVPDGKSPVSTRLYTVQHDSLYSILGEIPYFTYLYEKIKGTLSFEEFEKTEGIKKLFLETRDEYQKEFDEDIYQISLQDIQTALQFIRNLCLIKNRLTPDLYELVTAAKGIMGNDFALKLIEMAKFYPYLDITPPYPVIKMTDRSARLGQSVFPAYRRVPTLAREWKRVKLEKNPGKKQKKRWRTYWNPNSVCSWPPEDEIIENFCGYIRKRALKLAGLSQARVEEFKSTLKDGIHLRETLRNLHLGKIYVKEEPQIHGEVGAVVFIFDDDPDGQKYPNKLTWLAEHQDESTLAFYATESKDDMVGPGIARCFYGGALFIYPPQLVPEIWTDPKFEDAHDNAERLIMAGLYYSDERYVAVVAKRKPSLFILEYAGIQGKKVVFLPLSSFSQKTLQKLRYFHVLNGKHVRGWASHFIRPIN